MVSLADSTPEVTVDRPPTRVSMNEGKKLKEVIVRFDDGSEQVFPRDFERHYKDESYGINGVYVWGFDGPDIIDIYRGRTALPNFAIRTLQQSLEAYLRR